MAITGQKLTSIIKSLRQRERRDRVQRQLILMKGGHCERCLRVYHPAIYDFHHINPTRKLFNLDRSNFSRKWELIKEEVAKCALLCAVCHREVHVFKDSMFLDIGDKPL